MLRRRWFRWPLEAALIFIVIPVPLLYVNAQRECYTPEWGLPEYCSIDWIVWLTFWLLVFTIIVEAILWVRSRRPCPRCGSRVRNGRLDCPVCGFDFKHDRARDTLTSRLATIAAVTVLVASMAVAFGTPAPAHAAPALDAPPPTLTARQARTLAKKALAEHYTPIDERQTCKRESRLRFTCVTRWAIGDLSWSARIQLHRTGNHGSPTDRYTIRVVERNGYTRRARTHTHRSMLPTPTRRAPLGAWLALHPDDDWGSVPGGHLKIRVRPGQDPAPPVAYDEPAPGHRYVTFWLDISNLTHGRFEVLLFGDEAALVLADGSTVQGESSEPVEGCDQRLNVPEGETRTVCIAFELRHGAAVQALELNWGSGWPETGQWRL